jgi:archaemetzincin
MPQNIVVHPFDEVESDLVEAVRVAVALSFKMEVTRGEKLSVPARSYSRKRNQFLSTDLLEVLAIHRHGDKRIRLGITNVDLFVPELNFVFGEASSPRRVAVFSIARLNPETYGKPNEEALFFQRATIEAVHELGHVFGLSHCTRLDCVMWFSNTLSETDRKGSKFCQCCATKLYQLTH